MNQQVETGIGAQRTVLDVVHEMLQKGYVEEGIAPLIPAIDLSIRYSPVVANRDNIEPVSDIRRTAGGGYMLVSWGYDRGRSFPWNTQVVDAAVLTVMRARFMYRRGILNDMLMRGMLNVPYGLKEWVIANYFDGRWLDLSKIAGEKVLPEVTDELRAAWGTVPLPGRF